MRIQLVSDVHVEFDREKDDNGTPIEGFRPGASFIASLDPSTADVLVLAGDIGPRVAQVLEVVDAIATIYAPKPVIWVHGNHEYYGSSVELMRSRTEILCEEHENLFFLDNSAVTIQGRRFIGATMWYPDPGPKHWYWSDFRHIRGSHTVIPFEAQASRAFFERELRQGDIVVTHMLPSYECVAERWKDSDTNRFFVHDMTDLILARRPTLWMFGHTHDPTDTKVGETRCVANPKGYPYEKNPFNPNLIIEME